MAKEVEALTILLAARTAEFERGMASAEHRIDKVERRMRGSTAAIERDAARMAQRVSASMRQVEKSFDLRGVAIGGIGLTALAAEAVKYSDAWTKAGNSLKVAGVEASRQTAVMNALFASAQKNSTEIGALSDVFGKASMNAKELGADEAKLLKFTDGVAVAVKAAGKSTSESSGALLQLGQLLGAGTVRAEEFNSVLEGAPTILTAVAAGMDGAGGSVAKLRAMVLAGEVSSRAFFDAFLKGKPVIDDMAARALPTVGNAMTRINNALTKYVGENQQAQGATRALLGGLNHLADNFDTTADVALKFAGIIAAAILGRSIVGMVASLGAGASALIGFARALAAVRTAGGIAALTSAAGGLGAALGPVGALLGVAAAAGLYFAMQGDKAAEAADRAKTAIDQMGATAESRAEAIRKLAEELKKLGQAQLQSSINDTGALITQQSRALRGIGDTLPGKGGVGRGYVAPAGGMALAFNRATDAFFKSNDLPAYKRSLDDLAKRYPAQAEAMRKAQDEADLYSKAIDRQTEQFKESQRRLDGPGSRGPSRIQGEAYRGEAARAAPGGFTPAVAGVERDAQIEAAKGERERAIDDQTEKLVKEYEKTGNKITDAVREALRGVAAGLVDADRARKETDSLKPATAMTEAFDLIKKREGFRAGAYWDVNAFRAGYGSDTTTDASGNISRVTRDTIVSVEDATRDLNRRIGEFQNVIRRQIGADRFDQLGKNQQAALTSIAYNYGSLPDRIINAIRTGTTADVEKAIRGLGADNRGVNRERRNEEADIYAGGATAQAKESDKRIESSRDFEQDAQRKREDLELDLRRAEAKEGFNFALEKEQRLLQLKREAQDAGRPLDEEELARLDARAQKETELAQKVEEAERRKKEAKEKTAAAGKAVADAQEFFAEGATSAFTDIITGASSAEEALKRLVNQLLEASIQALLLGKGPLAGLFGTAAGSGGGLGGIFGMLFGGGKASGGRVSKGQVYPVGENGREFFAPGENGRIIPANNLPQPNMARAVTPQPANSNVNMRMSIDLRGANGDATIARIAREEAQRGAQQAFRAGQRDWPAQRKRYDQLKA